MRVFCVRARCLGLEKVLFIIKRRELLIIKRRELLIINAVWGLGLESCVCARARVCVWGCLSVAQLATGCLLCVCFWGGMPRSIAS